MTDVAVRESEPQDITAIEALYPAAFPDEDLQPLVRELLAAAPVRLSLVATVERKIVAHVVFSTCGIEASDDKAALLGPLAVAPDWQRRGVGTAIVREGLRRLREDGFARVFVLGDPGYYGRLGFLPERRIVAPYLPPADTLPEEWRDAWQSMSLGTDEPASPGTLQVPEPWRKPELWLP